MTQANYREPGLCTQRRGIGLLAIALSLSSMALIAATAPWQIRFPVVALAMLFGPAVPLLRSRLGLSLAECLVYGIGLDIALQMITGLALVMVRVWVPVAASLAWLLISLCAGLGLLRAPRSRELQ